MRFQFYFLAERFTSGVVGPLYRRLGRYLYALGTSIQGQNASEDRLVPSLRKVTHNDKTPDIEQADFVAPNAAVLGDVKVGEGSSIWYGATLLGTLPIRIGNNTVIQDRAHLSREVNVGNNVFVGPNSVLQGSKLQNRAFVGMGATVRHATVSTEAVVAAGAVVPDNTHIPSLQVWAGNPAQFVRNVTPIEKQILREYLEETQALARIHQEQTSKTFRELLSQRQSIDADNMVEKLVNSLEELELPDDPEDEEFIEQRIFMREKAEYIPEDGKEYHPYEYDMSKFPDEFQTGTFHGEFVKAKTQMEKKEFKDRKPWTEPF